MSSSQTSRVARGTAVALTALLAVGAQDVDLEAEARFLALPELDAAQLDAWASFIKLSAAESGFESIPWIDNFAEGVRTASERELPLFFWAMNGHPLGCT